MILSILQQLKSTYFSNHNRSGLTVEELTKTTWDLGQMDGSLIDQLRLLHSGEIESCGVPDIHNKYRWSIEDETLIFHEDQHQHYVRFTSCTKEKGKLFLTGRFSPSNSVDLFLMSYKAFELNLNLPINFYYGLGEAFWKHKRWKEAINSYRKALKLKPRSTKNSLASKLYLVLGVTQIKNGEIYGAITSLKKSIGPWSKQLGFVYSYLGNISQKKSLLEKAANYYKRALQERPWQNQRFYLDLRNAQLKLGKHKEAAQSYKKSFQVHYLISHKHKFIYCNIPKNATQLFRIMTVEHSDDRDKFYKWKLHVNMSVNEYLERDDAGVRLTYYDYLDNQEYFKFAILRNPFDRLVSGYLDKFVKGRMPQHFAHSAIKNVYKSLGMKPNLYKGITFSQFIHYLAGTKDDYDLDVHWRPQHTFLGVDIFREFDFIGQFEEMNSVIEYLENKFSFKIRVQDISLSPVHMTPYRDINEHKKYHEKYPEELRALDGFPRSPQLYTPELEMLVREKYAKDIEVYERKFNGCFSGIFFQRKT